jgi:parallel beta-helix repeat protein
VGNAAQIGGCVTRNNAGSGIVTGTDATLSDCVATNNSTGGISIGDSCTILNSTANQNGNNGGTTAGSNGISATSACTITNCTANKNTGDGLSLSTGGPVGGAVHNSTFNGNTLNGIDATFGSDITACTANINGGQGINVQLDCKVEGCTADQNTGNGIVLLGVDRAINNGCRQNGAAGILAQTAGGSRIEGNNVVVNINQGIMVTTTNCLIIRNTARANFGVNYNIAASNRYGPIVDISASGTAAVNGSSAPDTTTTTHPWANFSY